jgi:hypothetical protein
MRRPKIILTVVAVVIIAVIIGAQYFNPHAPTVKTTDISEQPAVDDVAASELVPLDIKIPKPRLFTEPFSMRPVSNLQENYGYGKSSEAFLVPIGTKNVALGKPVSSIDDDPLIGNIEMVTDGKKEGTEYDYVELAAGLQSVTIDLLDTYEIYAILLWHNTRYAGPVYFDVVAQVSNDRDFVKGVLTLFNNDIDNSAGFGIGKDKHYREIRYGKLIDAGGALARYVRLYSNGSNCNEFNHYVEVEVFGKPAK